MAWRISAAAISAVVLLIAGVVVWRLVQPERVHTGSAAYDALHKIVVDIGDGNVTLSPGTGGVTVEQRLAWTTLRTPALSESVSGDTLTIRGGCAGTRFDGHCTASLTITVPDGVAVDVRADAGELRAQGVTGALKLRAATGTIRGEGLRAGDVDVHIDSGDVQLAFAERPRSVTAAAEAGDVTVALAPGAYHVSADTQQGERDIQVTEDSAATSTVTARTSTGDVRIRYS
ncbi:DUF4097 family beta strand repeat-containing protein [Dactylosporangium sp. NPDC051541]|uniref:DUF4097 family beta strand repeat-containing protein n=1 Tax=Dactylosporangium sp. NPDC051541 TaxID=3363977 RepID=UPI003797F33F